MLEIINVTKSYPQHGIVLDSLNLSVKEGDSIAITGPSGSGKTTLMNLIGALDRPDSGNILYKSREIKDMDPDESAMYRNKNIGFVFQDHLLLPHLTARDNILLPLSAAIIPDVEYEDKVSNALKLAERVGIKDILLKYPFQISGGETQRVTLVRALVNKPSILLADEPTGSLDSKNADLLGRLLVEINRDPGITLIVATHSADLASKLKVHLKLEDGKLK